MNKLRPIRFPVIAFTVLVALCVFTQVQAQQPVCAPPPSGMVGWWPGDGNANDIVSQYHGTLQGGVTFEPGEVSQSFKFDGSTGYVEILDQPSLTPSSITLDAWVNPSSLFANPTCDFRSITAKYGDGPSNKSWILGMRGDASLEFTVYGGPDLGRQIRTSPILSSGIWTHVAATFDNTTQDVQIFVNGILVPSTLQPGAVTVSSIQHFDGPVRIGGTQAGCSAALTFWDGRIDEVELFARTLSPSEIQAIFAAGAAGKCKAPRYHVCLLYDPNRAVRNGATMPIKLQLCDGSGGDLSSPSVTVHAFTVTQVSSSISGAIQDSGNTNPDSDFRFDSSLGSTGGYIFNLKTTGLITGTYSLDFTVTGDSFVYSAPFQVK